MPPNKPDRISIVTPSYNQGEFIDTALRSVLQQNDPNFEHIVIDGGSTDDTLSVLQKHGHLIWISERDRGQAHAANKALRMATGSIIGWLNSDDFYLPDVFPIVRAAFCSNPDVGLVVGGAILVDENGRQFGKISPTSWDLRSYIYQRHSHIPHPAVFLRRSLLAKTGLVDESLNYAMDYDILIRLRETAPALLLTECLAAFRSHSTSKTHLHAKAMRRESRMVAHRYMTPERGRLLVVLGDLWWGIRGRLAIEKVRVIATLKQLIAYLSRSDRD